MFFLALLLSLSLAKGGNCHILENPDDPLLSKDGDVIIGAILIYSSIQMQSLPHSENTQILICIRINDNCGSKVLSMKKALMNERKNTEKTHGYMIPCKNHKQDISEMRYAKNIYSAGSLHCGMRFTEKQSCDKDKTIQPQQVGVFLTAGIYTTHVWGDVWFDSTRAMAAEYDGLNWQEELQFKPLICYDAFVPSEHQFVLNAKYIVKTKERKEKPRSVCSESCPSGTGKAKQKGRPVGSYDCEPCTKGKIINHTDANNCEQCRGEHWSNAQRDKCVLKVIEFLSFAEVMGIILVLFSLFRATLSVSVGILFVVEKDTSIFKANNSELSFLLLFSLTLCCFCSFTVTGRPSQWSCMLRHTAFGITFVLCISCVLGRTVIVLMTFRATLPGSNVYHSKKQVITMCKHKCHHVS